MAIIAKESTREWTQVPEGLHQAVCCDVIDLGLVKTEWGEKPKVKLVFQIALFDDNGGELYNPDFTEVDRRFEVNRPFGLSLSEKSLLRPFLEAWRGRKFTKEELSGFDLENLIGANCQVQIIHNITDQGRTFSNIQAIVPLGRGMAKIHAQDYVRVKDRAKAQGDSGTQAHDDSDCPF